SRARVAPPRHRASRSRRWNGRTPFPQRGGLHRRPPIEGWKRASTAGCRVGPGQPPCVAGLSNHDCAEPSLALLTPFDKLKANGKASILERQQIELSQRVDRLHRAIALEVPEGPAVAARCALQRLADAVDRTRFAAADDRSIGAHGGDPAALLVEQLRTRCNQPGLDELAESDARRILAALHRRQRGFVERKLLLDAFECH